MTARRQELLFRAEDPGVVVGHMERLSARHGGWLNLQPGISEEDAPPPPTSLGLIFSVSTHEVPVCTWVPGREGRHGLEPDSVGIEHATGTRVVARLAGLGVPVPDGWRWTQDHPRRGLVLRVPVGTPCAEQLDWLLRAGSVLSSVPLTGEWRALVYEGR